MSVFKTTRHTLLHVTLAFLPAWILSPVTAQERSLASMLPQSSVAYVEVQPAAQWLDHPLRNQIQQNEIFRTAWKSPDVMKIRGGMTLVELALGDKLENIARKLTAGGIAIAYDREHQGAILIARTESPQWLEAYLEKLIKFARNDAATKKQPDPVKDLNYRDAQAHRFQNAVAVSIDEVLIISNKPDLAKATVDRYLDKGPGGLDTSASFLRATEARRASKVKDPPSTSTATEKALAITDNEMVWAYVDVDAIRDAGVAKKAFQGKAPNFGAELVFGGLLATVQHTSAITGSLTLDNHAVSLKLSSPFDAKWGGEEREYFFGPSGEGEALPLLHAGNTIASLTAYRDISQLWLRAGDLLDAKANDQLAQAESTLTTLFSGRDFAEDILAAIHPEMRVVVTRQDFTADRTVPALRLPAFAIVAQLRKPDEIRPEWKRIFQSFIGFLNITGATNGQPQLDLGMESDGQHHYYTATYVRGIDQGATGAPIQFNFSPNIAFFGDHVVLSSSLELSKQLVQQLESPAVAAEGAIPSNTLFEIEAASVRQALEDNREQLVAQNMLGKGKTKEAAEAEIGTLLSLIDLLRKATLELTFERDATLQTTVHLAE